MSSTFRRLFIRYAGLNLLLLLLPLSLGMAYYLVSIRVIQDGIDKLIATRLEDEQNRLERLKFDVDSFMTNLSEDLDLSVYLNRTEPLTDIERYNLKKILAKLRFFILSNDSIAYGMVYFRNIDWVVSNSGFAPLEYFWMSDFSLLNPNETALTWKKNFLLNQASDENPEVVDFQTNRNKHKGIVLSKSIGYETNNRGKIALFLDAENLGRALKRLPDYYQGSAWIESADGTVLAASQAKIDEIPIFSGFNIQPLTLQSEHGKYRCYSVYLASTGWILKMALPEKSIYYEMWRIRNLGFLLFGIALLIGVVISWIIAYNHTRPLARIVERLLPTDAQRNRMPQLYGSVEASLNSLFQDNSSLKKRVESKQQLIQTFFLQNLLMGVYRERQQFDSIAASLNLFSEQSDWRVVLFDLIGVDLIVSPNDLLEGAQKIVEQTGVFSGYLVPMSSTQLAIILPQNDSFFDDRALQVLVDSLVRVLNNPASATECRAGVSSLCHDPFLLVSMYTEAKTAVDWLKNNPTSAVQYYSAMPYSDTAFFYPINLEGDIIKSVLAGNKDLFDSLALQLKKENFELRVLAPRQIRDLLHELRGTALKIQVYCDSITHPFVADAEIENVTADSLESWESCMHLFLEHRVRDKKSHNFQLVKSIREIVEKNYHMPDLSLIYIAEKLNISETYLSNFFKEQTGENLLAFIQQIRFSKGMMLLAESEKPIDEIAIRCGYRNPDSFRRAFRKHTGYTPSDYRNQKRRIK